MLVPAAALAELAGAIEPRNQGLAVKRDGTGRPIKQRVRHRPRMARLGSPGQAQAGKFGSVQPTALEAPAPA